MTPDTDELIHMLCGEQGVQGLLEAADLQLHREGVRLPTDGRDHNTPEAVRWHLHRALCAIEDARAEHLADGHDEGDE